MKIVVVGSSAGGPETLKKLFGNISFLSVPVVVAQHNISDNAKDFAKWLSGNVKMTVKIVSSAEELAPNTIYLTSGKGDLYFPNRRIVSIKESSSSISPSIDTLFESAASIFKSDAIGIILSGLGRDGIMGARKVKEMGGKVIVQSDSKFSYLPQIVEREVNGVIKRTLDEIILFLHSIR